MRFSLILPLNDFKYGHPSLSRIPPGVGQIPASNTKLHSSIVNEKLHHIDSLTGHFRVA